MPVKLPQPITVTDHYLAAVLEELRALNETMDMLLERAQKKTSTAQDAIKQAAIISGGTKSAKKQ